MSRSGFRLQLPKTICLLLSFLLACHHGNTAAEQSAADDAVVAVEDITRLPDVLATQIDRFLLTKPSRYERYQFLLREVTGIHWRYSETGTSIARDTYWNNEGNCLSWSLLAYAIATRLKLRVTLQEVDIPPMWDRYLNTTYLGRHVNILIYDAFDHNNQFSQIVIDFYPQEVKPRYATHKISLTRAQAMFYNNIGAEQFIRGNLVAASTNMQKALSLAPDLDGAWFNWGSYQLRVQQISGAKAAFDKAYALNSSNIATIKKLIALTAQLNLHDENAILQKKLARQLDKDPFYLHRLGSQYAEKQQLRDAVKVWEKADKISNFPEIKRDLIKAYVTLGNREKALEHVNDLIQMEIASEEKQLLSKKQILLSHN